MLRRNQVRSFYKQLTGGIRRRSVAYSIEGNHAYNVTAANVYTVVAWHDDSDLFYLRMIYEIRKPRAVNFRDIIPGKVTRRTIATGIFTPATEDILVNDIESNGIITDIQFITGLKIYNKPKGRLRREVNIGPHTFYLSVLEDCHQWVHITKDGMKVEKINRSLGIAYNTEPDIIKSRISRENIPQTRLHRNVLSFKHGRFSTWN